MILRFNKGVVPCPDVPDVPWHTQILADQLTLFQLEETDYAHLITTGTPGISDITTTLFYAVKDILFEPT